ncbi:MAG: hypothetical protein ACOC80_09875 [Petrotogales bacterium]
MPEEEYDQEQPTYGFERDMGGMLFSQDHEKTFIDKVLDRKDSERLRELMMEEELTRGQLLELLYIIVSINTKLVNYSDWDRYLLGKFLAWIRDFCTLHECLLDYIDEYVEREVICTDKEEKLKIQNVINTLYQIRKHESHNLKFLIDVFLYLSNSTLSISAVAFDTLSKSRFEYSYPQQGYSPQQPQTRSLFNPLKNKGKGEK